MTRSTNADPFRSVQQRTRRHRTEHGCGAYTYDHGSLLGVIAAMTDARQIVEVGTALGYTALWLAYGAPQARVDTIESNSDHVRIARQVVAEQGFSDRITVHHGSAEAILQRLDRSRYDVAFFDGFEPTVDVFDELRAALARSRDAHRGQSVARR